MAIDFFISSVLLRFSWRLGNSAPSLLSVLCRLKSGRVVPILVAPDPKTFTLYQHRGDSVMVGTPSGVMFASGSPPSTGVPATSHTGQLEFIFGRVK